MSGDGRSGATRRVAVVGGGITGLFTAVGLADAGAEVTLVEGLEAVGGQIRSRQVNGLAVDVGAESLHTALPEIPALLQRLGLASAVVDAAGGPTLIAGDKRLRRLPAGMAPTGPSRLWPVAVSGILSPAGLLRAACEPFVPGSHHDADLSVGSYLASRFGTQLVERLIDPLLGNLHAGDVYRLGLAAATPQLDQAARNHRSLVLRRRDRSGSGSRFVSIQGGLARIVDELAADPRIEVRSSCPVTAVRSNSDGSYLVLGEKGVLTEAEAVVLAVPAAVAARLIAPLDRVAGSALAGIESATVATVVVGYSRLEVATNAVFRANGLLVPSTAGRMLKAATFLSRKWPHLAPNDLFLVRMSTGRAGEDQLDGLADDQLVERLHRDLAELTGLHTDPRSAVVQRWPATMPQLHVGHRSKVASVRQRLDSRHRIMLAGAAYDGVGIGNCLRSANAAVARWSGDFDVEEHAV